MAPTDLEALWAGPFGDAYTERNPAAARGRGPWWRGMQAGLFARRCLEVGCNTGGNLRWFRPGSAFGADINRAAVAEANRAMPGCAVVASAEDLPFATDAFDLVFTCGLLIHIRRDRLSYVMRELARVACDWVLLMEYGASGEEAIPWRGQDAALWRAPYGRLFQEYTQGDFVFQQRGFLPPQSAFDRVTWWLFRSRY